MQQQHESNIHQHNGQPPLLTAQELAGPIKRKYRQWEMLLLVVPPGHIQVRPATELLRKGLEGTVVRIQDRFGNVAPLTWGGEFPGVGRRRIYKVLVRPACS